MPCIGFWFLAVLGVSLHSATADAQVSRRSGQPAEGRQNFSLKNIESDATVAFLELQTEEQTYFVGQRVLLRLTFGIDAGLDEANLIQLFQRRMRVPVQIDAPWLGVLDCTSAWSTFDPVSAAEQPGFVLNGMPLPVQTVEPHTENGRSFRVFEYRVSFVPACVGELLLPSASLRFSYAEEFRSDFLGRERPIAPLDQRLISKPLTLKILALPELERPLEFTGAVGQFIATASATPRSLKQGESLRLTARITGTGNLADFPPARLDWPNFHLRGVTDRFETDSRILIYDLAPLDAGPQSLRGFRFAFFDPTLRAYRSIETEQLSIEVLPSSPSAAQNRLRDVVTGPPQKSSPSFWTIAIGLVAFAGLLLLLRSWRRS